MNCKICFGPLHAPPDVQPEPESRHHRRRPHSSGSNSLISTDACITPCGHLFHRHCLESWLNRRDEEGNYKTCPSCRARVKAFQLKPAFVEEGGDGNGPQVGSKDSQRRKLEELEVKLAKETERADTAERMVRELLENREASTDTEEPPAKRQATDDNRPPPPWNSFTFRMPASDPAPGVEESDDNSDYNDSDDE